MSFAGSFVDSIWFDVFGVTYLVTVGFLYYSGFWTDINVLTEPFEELSIRYTYGVGLKQSQQLLDQYKLTCGPHATVVRIFYDRPKSVVDQFVRWIVGVKLSATTKDLPGNTLVLPGIQQAIRTSFSDRTFLSRWLANYRLAPYIAAFEQQFRLRGKPWLEQYHNGQLQVTLPLEDGDSFYVEEFFQPRRD